MNPLWVPKQALDKAPVFLRGDEERKMQVYLYFFSPTTHIGKRP